MKWGRRLGLAVLGLAGLWIVVCAAAWLAVPPLLQALLPSRLGAALGRPVTLGSAEFRPWALELTLRSLAIGPAPGRPAGTPPLLQVDRIVLDASARSLLQAAPVIERLQVDAPRLALARTGAGRYDVDDIVQRLQSQPSQPGAPLPRFALHNVVLRDGAVAFDDRPLHQRHQLAQLQLALPFLSSLPSQVDVKVAPRLAFTLDGARFDSGAQSTPFARSRDTALSLRAHGLDLARLQPYLPHALGLALRQGRLDADLALHFALQPDGRPLASLRGRIESADVALHAASTGAPLLAWRRLQVDIADLQPLARRVRLGAVRGEGLALAATRTADGRIDLLQLGTAGAPPTPAAPAAAPGAAPAAAPAAPSTGPAAPPTGPAAPAAAPAAPWRVDLQSLQLADARLRWRDASVQPAATLDATELTLQAGPLQWPALAAAAPLTLAAQLQGQGVPAPGVALQGRLSLDAALVREHGALALRVAQAQVADAHLAEAAHDAIGWQRLAVADARVDLGARRVDIGRIAWEAPALALQRGRDGRLNLQRWAAPAADAGRPTSAGAVPAPWRVAIGQASVAGGHVDWRDESAAHAAVPVQLAIDALALDLRDLAWPASATPVRLELQAEVADAAASEARRRAPGHVGWHGQLVLQPWALQGRLQVERFPLHALAAYADTGLNVQLRRAEAQWQGELSLRQGAQGLQAHAAGEAGLAALQLYGTDPATGARSPDVLLRWQSLRLHGVDVAVQPQARPRVQVAEAVLSDFYSQLVVTQQGRFNLRDLRGPGGEAPPAPGGFAVGRQVPKAAPPAVPAGQAEAPPPHPVDLRVGALQLVNGRVEYTDRFIKPNYSASVTELQGRLGAFGTGVPDMAPLALHGRVAGTAQLDVSGQLNPLAEPLALDVTARTSDLELAPLSPYAGKYVGYAIERGKLSMDVHYRVQPDGQLEAGNHVVLNQLAFGRRIDSPEATQLPVKLALALLQDRHGVVDLQLPVRGSLKDPQFSVAGLIGQVAVNLVAKAVTAPFQLLFGAHGGSDEDAGRVAFAPGSSALGADQQAAIDKVAQALKERDGLLLTVTGSADPAAEDDALRQRLLDRRLLARYRRELANAGRPGKAADPAQVLPAEARTRLLRTLYRDSELPDKPRNALGLAKDVAPPEMEALLKRHLEVDADEGRELALARGLAVREALIARGVPTERLFLAAPQVHEGNAEPGWAPHAALALSLR